jgi:transketolase
MHGWDLDAYATRAKAFGWHVITIDGHDVAAIDAAYDEARATTGRPTCIVAKTKKGKGVKAVEDLPDKHGKPLDDPEAAIQELGGIRNLHIETAKPDDAKPHVFPGDGAYAPPRYELGSSVATRKAYGDALAALGKARGDVVAIDGEVANSTYSELFEKVAPERFFEMYIAEQQMIAAAVGMQVRGWRPFASTFAAFLSRAYDFVRMAQISRATISLCGSHAGVSIGEDGPSQMALEDLAELRAIHGSTVLYPCDGNQTAALLGLLADTRGISYMRTTRGNTPVIYGPDESFEIGGSRVVRSSANDDVTIIGAGITLHEAMTAADALATDGIAARVIDLYSVKPIDATTVREAATATAGRVITVEDHWPEGGLGDAVLDALADTGTALRLLKLAPRDIPGSGTPAELLADAGIDAAAIADAARGLLKVH